MEKTSWWWENAVCPKFDNLEKSTDYKVSNKFLKSFKDITPAQSLKSLCATRLKALFS